MIGTSYMPLPVRTRLKNVLEVKQNLLGQIHFLNKFALAVSRKIFKRNVKITSWTLLAKAGYSKVKSRYIRTMCTLRSNIDLRRRRLLTFRRRTVKLSIPKRQGRTGTAHRFVPIWGFSSLPSSPRLCSLWARNQRPRTTLSKPGVDPPWFINELLTFLSSHNTLRYSPQRQFISTYTTDTLRFTSAMLVVKKEMLWFFEKEKYSEWPNATCGKTETFGLILRCSEFDLNLSVVCF